MLRGGSVSWPPALPILTMSDFSLLQASATEAQSTLAELKGMPTSATGNAIINGAKVTGVWGTSRTVQKPLPSGGYRVRVETAFSATKDQFNSEPSQTGKVTDAQSGAIWQTDGVDLDDALFYRFTLFRSVK